MFERFEKLVDPFEKTVLEVPPKGFWAFCWYYTKPVWPILAGVSLLGTLVAIVEVYIFTFLGDLVTWLENGQFSADLFNRHGVNTGRVFLDARVGYGDQ